MAAGVGGGSRPSYRPQRGSTAGFFDLAFIHMSMSALRDALRELPDAVFADLLESDEAYKLVLDVPGVTADTAEIVADGSRLTIEARREKAVPEEFRYLREDRPLFLDAELPVPREADGEAATAVIDRGVLEITLPKTTDDAGRSIPIDDAAE